MTVVVPALDAAHVIGAQLEALAAQRYDGEWEVVVADNGSVDGTPEEVRRAAADPGSPPLRVVDASGHRTVSHARNVGARAGHGELVVFCDADDQVRPGWLEAMARVAARCDGVGGAMELWSDGDRQLPTRPLMFGSGLDVLHGFLPYALGANCGVRRAVFDELGGFDESYAGGGDDVDFFWRLQLAGHRLGFAPGAVVRYRQRDSHRALARQYYRYGRADPQLYRRFRGHGMRRPPVGPAVARCAWLVLRAPGLLLPGADRGDWVWKAAWRAGHLVGSVRARTLLL